MCSSHLRAWLRRIVRIVKVVLIFI